MTWKEDITEYFAKNNVFRVKYLNDMLQGYCKEYILFINEFNGITATFNPEYSSDVPGILICVIDIGFSNDTMKDELKISCYFDNLGNLQIRYPDDYNYNAEWKHVTGKSSSTKKDFHKYQKEEVNEPEKIEKDYIFQIFNERLKQYIETQKSKQ